MRERLGTALYWLGCLAAALVILFVIMTVISAFVGPRRAGTVPPPTLAALVMIVAGGALAAIVPWLAGLACRCWLCADTPGLRMATYDEISHVAFAASCLWLILAALVALSGGNWLGRGALLVLIVTALFSKVAVRSINLLYLSIAVVAAMIAVYDGGEGLWIGFFMASFLQLLYVISLSLVAPPLRRWADQKSI